MARLPDDRQLGILGPRLEVVVLVDEHPDVLEAPFHLALRLHEPGSHATSCPEARRIGPLDLRIRAAAAQVAGQRGADLLARRRRCRGEQRGRGDDLPGRAETALEGVLHDERVLQRRRLARESPSIVVTGRPSAAPTGTRHETTGAPSRSTAHAPQAPSPQPSFAPVSARSSRNTARRRRVGATSSTCVSPLISSVTGIPQAVPDPVDRSSTTLGPMPGAGRSKLQSVTCVVLAAAVVLLAAGCGGGGSDDTTTPGCEDVDAPAPRDDGGQSAPTAQLDQSKVWTLTFDTSCGTFVVTLDLDSAPNTAASLVSLARAGYFDDTVFHRIVPGFLSRAATRPSRAAAVPATRPATRRPPDAAYTKGVVAMAKTAAEPAGTAGSQFFVVTGVDAGLPPEYAVVGTVTSGLAVVERIGQLGDPSTEQPTQPVVIDSVTAGSAP